MISMKTDVSLLWHTSELVYA